MAEIRVRHGQASHRVAVPAGRSVREALDLTALRVPASCGGTGTCGACRVRIVEGDAPTPTAAEHLKISPDARASGVRLACQLRPDRDLTLEIPHPAPPSPWVGIAPEDLAAISPPPFPGGPRFGVAVDLGTTHLRVAVWDLRSGRRVAARRGPNPQIPHGADVLNRLDAAIRDPARAQALSDAVRDAIVHAVRDVFARDIGDPGGPATHVARVVIVGNTAMTAILTGRGADQLVQPDHWEAALRVDPVDAALWGQRWPFRNAQVVVAPPIAGFIGSDLAADVIGTDLTTQPPGSALVDIGTNTEIALWDGASLHVTSVSGGPAFESLTLDGALGSLGAPIHRVHRDGDALRWDSLGGGEPAGLSGTGLTDAVAHLVALGVLKPSGRYAAPTPTGGYRLDPHRPRTAISGAAIDAFQRAKASIAAGVEALLDRAAPGGLPLAGLHLCGAFGRHLDVANAQAVGLLPTLPAEAFRRHGEASLAGAERALFADDPLQPFEVLRALYRPINLSTYATWENLYIKRLRLEPIHRKG